MINEYIRYRIPSERAEAFLAAYELASQSLRAAPECLGYELSRCTEEPVSFVLRIQWESEEAHLQGFRKGPQFPPFLQAIKPFIPDIEEMRHYAPTALRWSR